MADQRPTTKKTTPPSEWFKNVAKSVGYSTSDIIRDITPGIHTLIGDNVAYGKELVDNTKEAMRESKSMVNMFNMDNQFKIGRDALSNAIDDIKSGKIYNKERLESYEDDDFSEFMMDMDDGGSSNNKSSDDSPQPTIINNTKVVRENNAPLISAIEATAITNLKSTSALMTHNTKLHATKASADNKIAMTTLKGLESINENIGQLVNFQNDSMSKYVAASIQYYDESLGVMKNSLDKLIAMSPSQQQDPKQRRSGYEDVFGGGSFSLEGYMKTVKGNFDKMKDTNMLINFATRMFEDEDTLAYLAKSPLQFISNTITKHVVPMTIRSTMEQLDKSVTEFFPAMLNKLSRMTASSNPIFEMIGGLFGIDVSTKSSADMSKYMRGAIPFDGETKRAITDIIPTYLRKIYSSLSGKKEMAFDWEKGTWGDVDSMKADFEKNKLEQAKNAYSDQYNMFTDFMTQVRFENDRDRTNFQEGIEKFLYNLAKSDDHIKFDGTRESKESVNRLHDFGNDRKMQDLFYGMLNNLDRADQVNLVGAGRYKALDNIDKFFREIESNPTKNNAMTLLAGMGHDEGFEKNADGIITKRKGDPLSGVGSRVDKYGHDDLFYLRGIMDSLLEGIRVYPFKNSKDSGSMDADKRLKNFRSHRENKIVENSTKRTSSLEGEALDRFDSNLGIDLTGNRDYDLNDRLRQIKKSKEMSNKNYKDSFGDTVGSMLGSQQEKYNRVKDKLDSIVRKPADMIDTAFQKIDETMYNIVFGIKNDSRGSFMDLTLDKMQDMFATVGEFAIDKVFMPIGEFLGNTGKKAVNAVKENPLAQAVKDGVKYWFVGNKDENGKREGGVLSDIMNSVKNTALSFNHSVTGLAYTDANGVKHDKNPDSFFASTKNLVKDIYDSTKAHFFGDQKSDDKDKQRGMLTVVTDSLGDGMSAWSDILFGTRRDKEKSGTQILKENTTTFIKNVPRGMLGMIGGSVVGSTLAGGLGLVGSMFLPGAPVALAMLGGAAGMATGFDGFNNWAFGEIGGNGKRLGGALLSYNQKEFLKNNKNTLIGGAVGGLVLSSLGKTVVDGLIPGAGAIMDFLSPFGPIGAAMQGMATAMIMKSTAVMDWLFGPKNMDGARMGGLIQRIFKKPNAEISRKAVGSKAGFAAIGALGGAFLGSSVSTAISSFGLIPALLATPLGPVTGAIGGLAAALALSSGTVRKFLFGSYDEENDKGTLGFIGKSMNAMKVEVLEPMMHTLSTAFKHTANWFSNSYMAKLEFAVEPIIKIFTDTAKGLGKGLKLAFFSLPKAIIGTTSKLVSELIGDTIKEKVVLPIAHFFGATVITPIRKMNELLFNGIISVAKGINGLGASLLMVPAAIKMTMDQATAGTKSLFKGIFNIFKKDENSTVKSRFMDAFDPRRIYADMKSDPSASYVDRINARYNEKMDNYRTRRAEIKAQSRETKAEWKSARNRARGTNYNELGGEGDSLSRIIKTTNRKGIKNRDLIAQLQSDVYQRTGLTVNQLLGLNPDEDPASLSKNQLKALQGMIKTSAKVGKTGQQLKDHLGITEYQRTQEEAMKSIINTVGDMSDALKDINENVSKMVRGASKHDGEDGSPSKKKVRGKKNKQREEEARKTPSHDESVGGAVLGGIFNSIGSTIKGLFSSSRYTDDDVREIGCGPIVLAMAMGIHGVKVNPKEIFEFAMNNKLVEDGVGVSSNLFKLYAGRKGFTVEFAKGTASNLDALFKSNRIVIARVNTGAGHFVLLRGYDPTSQTVSVTDPMKQFGGRTDVKTIIRYVTHLYGIRKKSNGSNTLGDVKDITKKLFSSATSKVSSNSSIGGAVMGVAGDSEITRSVSSVVINGVNALPVFIVKSKEDEMLEEERFERLIAASGGGDDTMAVTARGHSSYNARTIKERRVGLNRINEIIDAGKGLYSLGRKGAGKVTSGVNKARGMTREDVQQMGMQAKGAATSAMNNARVTAAQGPYAIAASLLGGVGRAVGRIGKTGVKIAKGIGGINTGTKIMNALVQAGNASSQANLSALRADYNTSANAEGNFSINPNASPQDQAKEYNKHRNVNNFLKQKAEEASAQALANYQTTSIDLETRIEINTRYAAQRLDDLFDLNRKFFDWLKPFLENLDFCCPPGGGGGGGGGGSFFGGAAPGANNNKKQTGTNTNDRTLLGVPPGGKDKNNGGNRNTTTTNVPVVTTPGGKNRRPTTMPTVVGNPKTRNVVPTNPRTARPALPLPMPMSVGTDRKVKDAKTGKYRDLPKSKYPILDAKYEVIDESKTKGRALPLPADYVQKEDKKTKGNVKGKSFTMTLDPNTREKVPVEANRSSANNRKVINADPVERQKEEYKRNFNRMMEERKDNERKLKRGPARTPAEYLQHLEEDERIAREREERNRKAEAKSAKRGGAGGKKGIFQYLNNQRGAVDAGKLFGGLGSAGGKLKGALGGVGKAGSAVGGALKTTAGLAGRVAGNIPFLNIASAGLNAYNSRQRAASTFGVDEATKGQKLASTISGGAIGFIPGVGLIDYMSGGMISDAGSKLLYSAGSAIGKAGEAIAPTASKVWEGAKNIGGKMLDASPIGQVRGAIQGFSNDDKVRANLGKGADDKINTWDRLKSGASEVGSKASFGLIKPETIGKASEEIEALAKQTFDTIKGKVTSIKETTGTVWDATKTVVSSKWDETKTAVSDKVIEVVKTTGIAWDATKTVVSNKWDETKTAVSDRVVEVVTNTAATWDATKTLVSTKWGEAKTAVSEKAVAIVTDTKTKWDNVKTDVAKKWTDAKKAVADKTVAVVTDTKAKWDSVKTDVSKKWTDTKTAIKDKSQSILADTKTKWDGAKTEASKKWTDFKTTVSTKAGDIKKKITTPLSDGASAAASAFSGFKKTVSDLASGIAKSIKTKVQDAKSFIGGLFGKGIDKKKALGGPSETDDEIRELTEELNEENKKKLEPKVLKKGDKNANNVGGANPNDRDIIALSKQLGTTGKGKSNDIYYSQNDSRWANVKLAGETAFGDAGCGPTAVATVVSSLTGEKVLPTDALKFAQGGGMVDPQLGTNSSLFSTFGASKGVPIYEDKATTDNVMKQLAMGNKVILRGENGSNYTNAGHFIVADGLTEDGKIKIKDPLSRERSGEFSPNAIGAGLTNAYVASNNSLQTLMKNTGKTSFGKGSGFSNPAPGVPISSRYGYRVLNGVRGFHYGIDLAKNGTVNIQSAADGEVTFAGPKGTYGNVVILKHTINGKRMDTVYAHLRSYKVKVGDTVKQGQNLGLMGTTGRSTGQHLHFEIHNGPYDYGVNNVNPEPYIFANGDPTPEGFDGSSNIFGMATTAAAILAGTATSSFNPLDRFSNVKLLPDMITKLPDMIKNAANIALFGAPIAAATSSGSDVSTTYTNETIKGFKESKLYKGPYADVINKYAEARNLEPALVAAMIRQESNFNPRAVSPAGAKGLMQLMPSTASSLGVTNPFDPDNNVMGGSKYIRQQINSYKDLGKALAAYNAGPGNVNKYNGIPPFKETQGYVSNVIGYLKDYRQQFGGGMLGLGGGEGSIIDGDLNKNNIYDIMKKAQPSSGKGVVNSSKLPDVDFDNFASIGGPGDDISNIQTNSRIEDIYYENAKYDTFTTKNEKSYGAGDTNTVVNTFTDSWSADNIEKVVKALETIANNTSETNKGMSTMNNYFTNTTVDSSSNSTVKGPAIQQPRQIDQGYVSRNKQILGSRK